jgi:hypothetical protein
MTRIGRPRSVPKYRKYKQSGLAICTLSDGMGRRQDVLLGKYGTQASRVEYARVIAEWEAAGRSLPPIGPAARMGATAPLSNSSASYQIKSWWAAKTYIKSRQC